MFFKLEIHICTEPRVIVSLGDTRLNAVISVGEELQKLLQNVDVIASINSKDGKTHVALNSFTPDRS